MGPLGASFGPLGRLLGRLGGLLGPLWDLLGAFWGGGLDFSVLGIPLEPLLGPSWGLLVRLGRHLGRLGGPLGPFRGRLGSLVGRLGAVLGASWAVLERPEAEKARTQKTSKKPMEINDFGLLGPSSEASWKALGASWRPLGLSWGPLGPSWGPHRPFWGLLGGLLDCLGAVWGVSWALFERRNPEKARRPNTLKKPMNINDFGLLGPSSEASWKALGASWRPLGLSWGHLGRLRAIFGRLGALLDRLGGLLGPSWPVLGPSWRAPGRSGGVGRASAGLQPGYFSSGGPQRPPRARELEYCYCITGDLSTPLARWAGEFDIYTGGRQIRHLVRAEDRYSSDTFLSYFFTLLITS